MQFFFQELYSHIDRNSGGGGGGAEDMFLVKIASKETSLIVESRLEVEVLNDQNLFTESNLANWFSSYVKFCSGGHFSEVAEAARQCGIKTVLGMLMRSIML